jgi:hypothetical protein
MFNKKLLQEKRNRSVGLTLQLLHHLAAFHFFDCAVFLQCFEVELFEVADKGIIDGSPFDELIVKINNIGKFCRFGIG